MKKLKNFLTQHSFKLFLLFILGTSFFLLEHYLYQGWDFSAYALNAQYLFDQGQYFEISRAPLMSLLLGLLSFLGWRSAEYLYIVFASGLFFLSTYFLARELKLNEVYFYLFSLNAFVLLYGLVEGTELLALALLELFLLFLIKNKGYAGFFLGLVCLTRYPSVIFFPLLLFHKGWRIKIASACAFVLAFVPWFMYNYFSWENVFYSIADSYALNILYRDYVPHAFHWTSVLLAANVLLPLLLFGVFLFLQKRDFRRETWIILAATVVIIYSVYTVKADVLRYYIALTIPFVFFSVYAFNYFSEKQKKYFILIFFLFTILGLFFGLHKFQEKIPDYSKVFEEMENIQGCQLSSNIWVDLSYRGRLSEPFPREEMLQKTLEESYVLFFYPAREPEYMSNASFLEEFPIYSQTEEFIILGDTCSPIKPVNSSYLQQLNRDLLQIDNYTISEDPCEILFSFSCSYITPK